MKEFFLTINIVCVVFVFAQNNITKSGLGVEGYDVVSYFSNRATEGSKEFTSVFKGVKYIFSSKENLVQFEKNPSKYVPQYGGWCAYAMAVKGEKVDINPNTFEIRDGKLYLFYNAYWTNTLESWLEENPEGLIVKADQNWKRE